MSTAHEARCGRRASERALACISASIAHAEAVGLMWWLQLRCNSTRRFRQARNPKGQPQEGGSSPRALAGRRAATPERTDYGFTSGYLSLNVSTVSVYSWLALT
jgi:hypothetical protein